MTGGGVPVIAAAGGDAADPDETFTVTGGTGGTGSTNGTHLNGGGSSFTATTGGGGSPGGTSAAGGNGATGDVGGGAGTAGGRGRGVLARASTATLSARRARSATARPAGHPRRGEQPGCGSGGRERRALTAASTLAATGNAARAAQLAMSSSLSASGLISSALAVLEATAGYRGSGDRRRRDAGRAKGPGRHGRMPGAVSVADHDT